jgi:methionyl-tRNA formyltransferase
MRILFMGTPDFAAVSLRRLVEDGHEVCGVFTQPDKPRNRNKVTFSPVKEYALSQGIPVYQPLKLRDGTGPVGRPGPGAGAHRGGGLRPHSAG